MLRYNHADQLSKNILRDALSLASTSETEVEVLAATQRIDVYAVPDPARAAERRRMGLLGKLSEEPALFEPFRNTPSLTRVRACLRKQLTWHSELERRARAAAGQVDEDDDTDPPAPVPFPWLVVISPGRPETALAGYGCQGILPGVYEAVPSLLLRVVVLAELPRTRDTLLLRLLGPPPMLHDALEDLQALPADSWERSATSPILVHFRLLGDTPEEEGLSAEIRAWYEEYQREQQKREADREARGEAKGEARALLAALRARGIPVPDAARERILAEKDPDRLERWVERAVVASSLADVLDDPS
jgi:hypothetical protein